MNELLVRLETLCLDADPPLLIGVGAGMAILGLFLWLGGTRYSTVVIGLLGAAVGAFLGLAIGQQFDASPFLGIGIGAVVLGVASMLLRNVLIIVLATVIFALVAGGGYAGIMLDRQPAQEAAPDEQQATGADRPVLFQSFNQMDNEARQAYLNEISGSEPSFQEKLAAVLKDTWNGLGPYKWYLMGAILIGGIGGFLLIWFVKQVVVPLCYSIVGATSLILGAQLLLLGVGLRAASSLPAPRWIMPAAFGVMSVIGWVAQLLAARKPRVRTSKKKDEENDEE